MQGKKWKKREETGGNWEGGGEGGYAMMHERRKNLDRRKIEVKERKYKKREEQFVGGVEDNVLQ